MYSCAVNLCMYCVYLHPFFVYTFYCYCAECTFCFKSSSTSTTTPFLLLLSLDATFFICVNTKQAVMISGSVTKETSREEKYKNKAK